MPMALEIKAKNKTLDNSVVRVRVEDEKPSLAARVSDLYQPLLIFVMTLGVVSASLIAAAVFRLAQAVEAS